MILRIISPAEVLFEGEVQAVTLPGTLGAFTVLRNHASLISSLSAGNVSYTQKESSDEEDRQKIAISGGIVVVEDNVISVCVD